MKKDRFQHWILAADLIWISVASVLALIMRYGSLLNHYTEYHAFFPLWVSSLAIWMWLFSWMKLDGFRLGWYLPAIISELLIAISTLLATLLAGSFLARHYVSRLALAYFGVLTILGLAVVRRLVHVVLKSPYLRGQRRRVLIVGSGPIAQEMALKIQRHPEMLCEVAGFLCPPENVLDTSNAFINLGSSVDVPIVRILDILTQNKIDEVIVTLSKPGVPEVMNLIARCRSAGAKVSIVPRPYELYLSKPELVEFGGLPLLQLNDVDASFANGFLKRCFDLGIGTLLLVLSIPLTAFGALMLARKKGGALCSIDRCGRFGKDFKMFRLNSDRALLTLSRREQIFQYLSITELPQLLNVLRGDMSLVGPRPESMDRVKHYSDWQRQRLNVKPGITGLAQVHGLREQHSSEEKTRFDLQYILHSSPVLDTSILIQTFWILLRRSQSLLFGTCDAKGVDTTFSPEGIFSSAHSTQSSAD